MKILVCEDDREIARAISTYLTSEGYEVKLAVNGLEGVRATEDDEFVLVLMDIMMPIMDGIEATLQIRKRCNMPIILLTAKGEDYDKVLGLNSGADDYVTKPFNPMELMARVRSQLRRYTSLGSRNVENNLEKIAIDGLEIFKSEGRVSVDGEDVNLTPKEFKILLFLAENHGTVFSSEAIYERVWREPAYNCENTVAVHIRRIREKIEIDPKNPRYVKVVWGLGYKIDKRR